MIYLFFQVWLLLLIAFILGWLAHWFFCCRNKQNDDTIDAEAGKVTLSDSWKPQGFASRPDKVDDLKRVKGIGEVIETTLNELGIWQFNQIAEWGENNVSWVENYIDFPGRIERESWISQAKTLANGGTTEFANRVDKGEVDYDS